LAKNEAEVEFGEMAQRQAQNPQLKQFAQTMVQDHRQLVQQLQPLAGAPRETTRASASTSAAATSQIDAQRQAQRGQAVGQNEALNQRASIERQIGERCKEALREELQQKQGAEFDKCYIGSQVAGHMQMLAALEVLEQQGPDQINQIAQQARPKVQQHLEHAKQLMKQLEGTAAASTTNQAERQSSRTQR
jgi:predicted outer membrane protein